jgi:hypothetical protein
MLIKDASGNVFYSSEEFTLPANNPANIKLMDIVKGNIQVHVAGIRLSQNVTTQAEVNKISENVVAKLDVLASPNPFTDRIRFTIRAPKAGRATLEVYNMLGQKVGIAFEGLLNDNETRTVEFNAPANHRSNLIYTFRMNGEQINGKLISIKQ